MGLLIGSSTVSDVSEFGVYKFQVSGSSGLSTETDKNTHFPVIRFTHTTSAETLDLFMYYKGTDTWEVNFGAWLPSGTSAVGAWTWSMTSGDAGLQGHANESGSLTVGSSSHRGALMPHPTKKKFYFVQSGLPFIPFELRTAFFASDVSEVNFTTAANFMQTNGIPGLETQLTLENAAPNDTTWDGTKNDWIFSDKTNTIFDQTVWDTFQDRMDILNARELGAHVMFYSDDAGNPDSGGVDFTTTQGQETIPKYAAARLAGYSYLMWNGGIDGSEYYTTAEWNTWADNLISYDPYNHAISNRAGGGVTAITNETYESHINPLRSLLAGVDPDIQSMYDAATLVPGNDDAWGINRSSHSAKDHTDDDSYIMHWRVLIAGGGHFLTRIGTSHTGSLGNNYYNLADLQSACEGATSSVFADTAKHFKSFFDTYLGADYLNMQRDDSYTTGNGNAACAEVGNKVVILSMRGSLNWDTEATGDVTLDLTAETGTWSVTRYNILTGAATGLTDLSGGGSRAETPPNSTQSWIYYLVKQ